MIVLRFSFTAKSKRETSSTLCCAVLRPFVEGQSILPTLATHTPRISRATSGGSTDEGEYASAPIAELAKPQTIKTTKAELRCMSTHGPTSPNRIKFDPAQHLSRPRRKQAP